MNNNIIISDNAGHVWEEYDINTRSYNLLIQYQLNITTELSHYMFKCFYICKLCKIQSERNIDGSKIITFEKYKAYANLTCNEIVIKNILE